MIQPTTLSLQKESDVERMQVSLCCAKPTRITPAPIRFRVQITDYISLEFSSPVNTGNPTLRKQPLAQGMKLTQDVLV